MIQRKIKSRPNRNPYRAHKFEGGGAAGASKFMNFVNSDAFKGMQGALTAFNASKSDQPDFLGMNRAAGGGGGTGKFGAIGDSVDMTGQLFTALDNTFTKKRQPLSKTIGLEFARGGNLFFGGGDAMNMGSTLVSLVGNAKNNSKIADTTGLEAGIRSKGIQTVGASNKDELMEQWGNITPMAANVKMKDLRNKSLFGDFANSLSASAQGFKAGSALGPIGAAVGGVVGGLSSVIGSIVGRRKAKRKARKLNNLIEASNEFQLKSMENKAENLGEQDYLNTLANYSALGGPLESGAIDYEMEMDSLNNEDKDTMAKQRFVSVPPSTERSEDIIDVNPFAVGGPIHIKKANRGKFTSYCGGKVTDACIERGKDSNDPAVRKRAVFAENARGWQHADGGPLGNSQFSNGVTTINNGGTHEENPNDGVQIGMDSEGIPNLVEEGEVIYDNFVYSNRIPVPEALKRRYKLKGNTFASAAKALQKESAERPNDPISQRGLKKSMQRLAAAQEALKAKQAMLQQTGSYNPYESLEYAFGGNLFAGGAQMEVPPFYGRKGPVFMEEEEEITPFDLTPIERAKVVAPGEDMPLAPMKNPYENVAQAEDEETAKERPTWMRYAPVAGAGLAVLSDLFSKPDYGNAERMERAAERMSPVEFDPIGNYLSYRPMDREFYLNKLAQNAAASRRALRTNAAGNPAAANAAILASDYNMANALGNFARQAEEYNQQQRERVEAFNRGTNQYNSEGAMRAQMANNQNEAMKMRMLAEAARMREQIAQQRKASRSANLSAFFQGLGDIGSENEQGNWIDRVAGTVYRMDTKGNKYTSSGKVIKNPARRRKTRKG